MRLDIPTLAVTESLILIAQVLALFLQHRVNKAYRGTGWWLGGSAVMSLGLVFTYLFTVKPLELLARISNPLILLGYILLYVGVVRFFNRKESRRFLTVFYTAFLIFYYYFMLINNAISGRAVVVSTAVACICLMTAYELFKRKERTLSDSANFAASFFLLNGVFLIIRGVYTLITPPITSYSQFVQMPIHVVPYVIPIFASTLWTFGFIIMVNQRLNAENQTEREKMQLIFNTSPEAALITRLTDGFILDANAGFSGLTGYSRNEIIGCSTLNARLWHNAADREFFVTALQTQGFCENFEFVFERKDRTLFDGVISSRLIDIHGHLHVISVLRDITDRKLAELALKESEETYRSILNASPDDITITDLEGRILMVSPAAKSMFGYESDYEGFQGAYLLDFIVPEDADRARANIRNMYQGAPQVPNEYRGVREDKSLFDIEVNSGFIRGLNGQPIKMVFIVRNITGRKQAEQHIQKLMQQLEIERNTAQLNSMTDSLTGLYNRRYLDDALHTEFFRLKRSGSPLSLILLDVDHFKNYNDYYGHLTGDDCLRQLGVVLKSLVERAPDVVARYGGEEFVVILPETDAHGAVSMAEHIRTTIEALAIPHAASDTGGCVTVSLGVVTVYTTGFSHPDEVLALADDAMYRAKQEGRNRVTVGAAESGISLCLTN